MRFTLAGDAVGWHGPDMVSRARILVLYASAGWAAGWAPAADAAPLPLYDTTNDATALAPLAPPAPSCGGFAVACSAAPVSPHKALPFDYGLSVSGVVGGSSHGAFGGYGVSGWVKPKDIPLTLYFDYEHLQPIGRPR